MPPQPHSTPPRPLQSEFLVQINLCSNEIMSVWSLNKAKVASRLGISPGIPQFACCRMTWNAKYDDWPAEYSWLGCRGEGGRGTRRTHLQMSARYPKFPIRTPNREYPVTKGADCRPRRRARTEGRKKGEGLKCCQSVWQNRGRAENRIPELLTPRRRETTHGIAAEGMRYTEPRKVIGRYS